ncbi:MAG: hypothetical protein J6M53_05355 [Bacteroidaceae bacterium]|nr:hypothetical protein [Bacteroidaceae bacterium]
MTAPILRHISKIEYCAAYHLRSAIILPAQARALIKDVMPWQELPLVGLAQVETSDEVERGMRLYTTKLTATLCQPFNFSLFTINSARPLAFRLTDVQGRQYLLGTSQPPYPLVSQTETKGNKPTDRTAYTFNIQHTSPNSLLEIST